MKEIKETMSTYHTHERLEDGPIGNKSNHIHRSSHGPSSPPIAFPGGGHYHATVLGPSGPSKLEKDQVND